MSEATRAVTLETAVDTTGARAGFQEIQREAGTMAAAVARSSEQADQAVGGIGNRATSSARTVEASQRSLINSIQRTSAAMQAGSRSGSAYYEVLARQRGVDPAVLEPYLRQLRAIEQAQARANGALNGANQPLHQAGASAAQTANAMRMIPAQLTDIATQLQGGASPFTVLLQQGGQLRDSFGSVSGVIRGVGSTLLGMVNPLTVGAAAAAALAYAYKQGRDEAKAFSTAIINSGNAAGTTAKQLSEMARNVGQVSGNRGDASAALTALVQTGQVQAQNLQQFAQVAVDAQNVMGKKVEETTAEFEKLGRAPLQGLTEMSAKYHNVTTATYAQVKALQDQGKYAEAANVAQQSYADGVTKQKQAVLESLTDWERGWERIKNGISSTVDELLHLREATDQQKIDKLLGDRDSLLEEQRRAKSRGLTADVAAYQAGIDANKRSIDAIRDKGKAEKDVAVAKQASNKADEVRIKWAGDVDVLLTKQQKLQRDLTAAEAEGIANGLTHEEILKRQEVIRRQNYDVVVEGIERQIGAIRRLNAIEEIRSQRRLMQIAASRGAGDMTEDDATKNTAQEELASIDRKISEKQAELAKVRQRVGSEADQDNLGGEIAELREQRVNRQIQLQIDLAAAQRNRADESNRLATAGLVAAQAERDGLLANVKAQQEYNEEIGLSSEEVMELRSQRAANLAMLKDETAAALDLLKPGNDVAQTYREQAAALRERSAAERVGFAKSNDPYTSLSISLKRYVEDSEDSGRMIGDALTGAFRSAEDAFADFVTTGKLNFSSLATSIIADFARIEAKAAIGGFAKSLLGSMGTDTTSGWGSSLMKALGVSGARAAGGPVNSGLSYLVGEKGPEIFTPSSGGSITPNHMIGAGSGGGNININTSVQVTSGGATSSTSGDQGAAGKALADMISTKAKEVILRESRQGGLLWNMKMGRA